MFIIRRRRSYKAALFFTAILVFPALATPPAIDVIFVDTSGLEALIEAHFGAESAQRAQAALEDAVADRAPLRNSYGDPFVAIRERAAISGVLKGLWPGAADRGGIDGFRAFLSELNKAPLVRAVVATPGFSGCAMVLFRAVEIGGRFSLEMTLSAHQYQGCSSIYGSNFKMTSGSSLP